MELDFFGGNRGLDGFRIGLCCDAALPEKNRISREERVSFFGGKFFEKKKKICSFMFDRESIFW
ncbi:MAG: hypothetical protein Q4G69_00635 [Planctomycetia bacterium]|nr:hypothetical protein [Planctomycetia bacterium]